MRHETILLSVPGAQGPAELTAYVPDNFPELGIDRRRPALIICPGGGYAFLSDREGEPVALRFAGLGAGLPQRGACRQQKIEGAEQREIVEPDQKFHPGRLLQTAEQPDRSPDQYGDYQQGVENRNETAHFSVAAPSAFRTAENQPRIRLRNGSLLKSSRLRNASSSAARRVGSPPFLR